MTLFLTFFLNSSSGFSGLPKATSRPKHGYDPVVTVVGTVESFDTTGVSFKIHKTIFTVSKRHFKSEMQFKPGKKMAFAVRLSELKRGLRAPAAARKPYLQDFGRNR